MAEQTKKAMYLPTSFPYPSINPCGAECAADVRMDVQGKWDIDTTYIKDPQSLKQYLESRIVSKDNLNFYGHQ